MLRYNDKDVDQKIEENLSVIREVMDRKTFSPADQCQKLDDLTCLLGMASETRAVALHLCAHNERLAIAEKNLKGQSVNKEVVRYAAYENMLYEYADTIHSDMIKAINALQTLISFSKKEGY